MDILYVTDPTDPVQIAETGLADWPAAQSPPARGDRAFHHDMQIKKIGDWWKALLSYWDAGWVILDVTDPANPTFEKNFDYPTPDALTGLDPEGNAHQAWWSSNNQFIVGTDEDFSPTRTNGVFDGWGYVHLLDANTLEEIDAYAVPEALDPAFAEGFGALTVHEVETDPRPNVNLAYFSYYSAGLRVAKFGRDGIEEVGTSSRRAGTTSGASSRSSRDVVAAGPGRLRCCFFPTGTAGCGSCATRVKEPSRTEHLS